MPKPIELILTPQQFAELTWARDHHPLAYIREQAAALIKISGGQSGLQVARHGLLKPRAPDTVYDWVKRYRAGGLPALQVRPGRGRKPAFSPSASNH